MFIEIKFGNPVKIGKEPVQSWHKNAKANVGRFDVERNGNEFLFTDSKGELPSTLVNWSNIVHCIVETKPREAGEEKKVAKNAKKSDK